MYIDIIINITSFTNSYFGISLSWTLFFIGFIQALIVLKILNKCGWLYHITSAVLAGGLFVFFMTDSVTGQFYFNSLFYVYIGYVIFASFITHHEQDEVDEKKWIDYMNFQYFCLKK
ncbi:hypothetical protein ACPF04_06410 [Campylobacter sp. MOP51]|uniref:hypothetical protein n=1 Tax=Campylobacter canis TaxID=3378588 RepID=UPI003C694C84